MSVDKKLMIELKTVKYMIDIYCRKNHHNTSKTKQDSLCEKCSELYEYAKSRLHSCKFGSNKPACADCTIHCYKPVHREEIKKVMRFSGPRMVYTHPVLAIKHLLKKVKK